MISIKFSDPTRRYSDAALKTGLRLVVSNAGPKAAHAHSSQASANDGDPFLRSFLEGQRTVALTKVIGSKLAKGLGVETVRQIALDWNARQTPPLPEDKVHRTVDSLAATDARNHPGRNTGGLLAPLFNISEANIGLLLQTSPPPRRWLLHDMLPSGIVGMIVAPGGMGKSQFVLQLGATVASGIPMCELWPASEQGDVLLLPAEDDIEEVHRRLERVVQEFGTTDPGFTASLKKSLHIKSMVAQNNLMTHATRHRGVEQSGYVDRLLMTVAAMPNLKLIVIDPASRFRGGDENSADDVTRFIEQLERLRHATGAAVIVCHHASKASMNQSSGVSGQASTRGSSAMTDGVRWQMNLTSMSKKSVKDLGLPPAQRYLIAEVVKSNYGRPTEPEVLMWRNGCLVSIRTGTTAVTLEDRVVQLIRDEALFSRGYSANGIIKKFGGEDGQLKAGQLKLRETIKALLNAGRIRREKDQLIAMPSAPAVALQVRGSIS